MTTRPTYTSDGRRSLPGDAQDEREAPGPRYVRSSHATAPQQSMVSQQASEARFDPRAWRNSRGDTIAPRQTSYQAEGYADAPIAPAPAGLRRPSAGAASAAQPIYMSGSRSAEPLAVEPHVPREVPAAAAAAAALALAGGEAPVSHRRTHYIAVWAVIGSMSAAYLAGMAWQRSSNFNVAVAPIAAALERITGDIAELRQTTSAIDARERQTAARLTSTETRIGRFSDSASAVTTASAASAPALPAQRPGNRLALADEGAPAPAEPAQRQVRTQVMPGVSLSQPGAPGVVIGAAPSMVPADVRVDGRLNPSAAASKGSAAAAPAAASGVRTGSLNDPATKRRSGLLVGSGTSMEAVRQSWDSLSQNHGGAMGAVEALINPSPDGTTFQLIAGPYVNDFEAAKACSNLRSRGVTCRPVEFSGSPF